jgi:hypothetical protein
MSDLQAILQPNAVAYGGIRWGVWDLAFPTITHRPSPPRQRSLPLTLPVSTRDRPTLAHGSHDGGRHI